MGEDSTPAVDHLPGRFDMMPWYISIGEQPMRYTVAIDEINGHQYLLHVVA